MLLLLSACQSTALGCYYGALLRYSVEAVMVAVLFDVMCCPVNQMIVMSALTFFCHVQVLFSVKLGPLLYAIYFLTVSAI
jgi:hypothetical protein